MSRNRAPLVAVIGAATCTPEQSRLAYEVGRLLAAGGVMVVCGGGGGVMEAACKGAQEAEGVTIGLLPGTDSSAGNPYLTVAIATGLGQARNALVAQAGQSVIAIGGGYGTLSEIGMALKRGRRVIGLQTWKAIDADGSQAVIMETHSPQHAVDLALAPE